MINIDLTREDGVNIDFTANVVYGDSEGKQIDVAQTVGASKNAVMSQFAVTQELSKKTDDDTVAQVAKTGNYNDLKNRPDVYTKTEVDNKLKNIDLTDYATKNYVDSEIDKIDVPDVSKLATKAEVSMKADKGEVPTMTSQLVNNSGFITRETDPTVPQWAKNPTKPTYSVSEIYGLNDALSQKISGSELSNVAKSGSYNDLKDKPAIPTALSQLTDDAEHRLVTDAEKELWNSKGQGGSSFSGDYNDLTNKPNIPTKLSELENDTNFAQGISVVTIHNNEWVDNPDTERWEYKEDYNVLLLVINPNERIIIDSPVSLAGIYIVPNTENAGNSATYELVFATSDTEFSLGTIEDIFWSKEPIFNPNKTYAISIESNNINGNMESLAMYAEFDTLNMEE